MEEREPKSKTINYKKLFLDKNNPRLPKSLHNKSEFEIIDYLLLHATTLELMQAIGENNFFMGEQLLVVKSGNDRFKVIEGNRRLTAVKLLNDYSIASVKKNFVKKVFDEKKFTPTDIPCLIFDNEDYIRKYLGFRHITGIKSWRLSQKAAFLSQLKETHFQNTSFFETCRGLAKIIGSRKDYVERLLVAYDVYKIVEDEGFYEIRDLDDTTFYVGYISDSLSKTNIVNFLGIKLNTENPIANINKTNLKELIHWFFEKNDQNQTRLKGKSSDLKALNKVLASQSAVKIFREGEKLSKALELTEDTDDIFRESVKKSLENLEMSDRMMLKVKNFYYDANDDLDTIRKLAIKIKRAKEDLEDER
jgi:hypothetical protein